MATFKLGTAARHGAGNGIVDLLDGGTPPGRLEHRTGAQPTNVSDASSGTLLGTNLFSNPAFGNAGASVTGRVDAAAISNDTSADSSGTAGYHRAYAGASGDTTAIFQGDTGTSGAVLNFDNNVFVAGGVIAVSSYQITVPIT